MTSVVGAVPPGYVAIDDRTREILERRRTSPTIKRRGWFVRRALLVTDLVGLTVSFVAAQELYATHGQGNGAFNRLQELLVFLVALPVWVVAAKLYGLYDKDEERTDHSTADDFAGVFHLVTVCSFLLYALSVATRWFNPQFGKIFAFWIFGVLVVTLGRAATRAFCRRRVNYLQNTAIVGAGDVGQSIARKLLHHPEYGLNLVGFVDSQPKERRDELGHLTLLGGLDRLPAFVELLDIERVIVAFSNDSHEELIDAMRLLNELDVQVDIVPRLFEIVGPGVDIHSIEGVPVIGVRPLRLSWSSRLVKRSFDIVGAVAALIVTAPILVVAAVAIKLGSAGPILFRQTRMGEGGHPFRMLKFRTMTWDAEERKADVAHLNKHFRSDPRMFKIDDDPRVTRVGRVLRRFSIDELPQLWNVLIGHMSLVGPRPLILEEDAHVTDWAERRLDLKPGMTGLWQVLGRDAIPFDEMVKLDYLYVTSWSLGGDTSLVLRTLPLLLRGV